MLERVPFILRGLEFDIVSILVRRKMRERRFGRPAQNAPVDVELRLVARTRKRRLRVAFSPLDNTALMRANRRNRARLARWRVIQNPLFGVGKRERNRFADFWKLSARNQKAFTLRFGLQLRIRTGSATIQKHNANRCGGAFEKGATRKRRIHREKGNLKEPTGARTPLIFLEKQNFKSLRFGSRYVHHLPF